MRNIPCAHLSSSQTAADYRLVSSNLRKSPCPYRLLYVTPERFQVSEFISTLSNLRERGELVMIAVDEAHCISTYVSILFLLYSYSCPLFLRWGHDFRSAYRELSSLRAILPDIPIMALSATATKVGLWSMIMIFIIIIMNSKL